MFIIDVLVLAVTCSLVTVNCSSVKSNLQYDHSFDPRAHKNPGKTEYHIDLDSLIEEALTSETELRKLYNHYKAKHGVSHGQHETAERLQIFRQYLVRVQELQRDDSITWTPGITFMAHMTDCEQSLHKSGNRTDHLDTYGTHEKCDEYDHEIPKEDANVLQSSMIPTDYDWRALGAITPVREQIGGRCWAYTAVTPMEAQIKKLRGVLENLSVQELVDCTYYGDQDNFLDEGGFPHHGWDYVKKEGRIGYDAQISVRPDGTFGGCSYGKWARNALTDHKVEITHISILKGSKATADNIMTIIAIVSPVVVGVNSDGAELNKYKGGPFDPRRSRCSPSDGPDHGVSIVGYDKDYFYIKNSWGDDWGQDGYLWWVRAPGTIDCSIYEKPMYLIMDTTD